MNAVKNNAQTAYELITLFIGHILFIVFEVLDFVVAYLIVAPTLIAFNLMFACAIIGLIMELGFGIKIFSY